MTDTEKEAAITAELKFFLKGRQPPPEPTALEDLDTLLNNEILIICEEFCRTRLENTEEILGKIFRQLTSLYRTSLQVLPVARRRFYRCLELAEEALESEIRTMWKNLLRQCRVCLEYAEALGMHLSTMRVIERGGDEFHFPRVYKNFMVSYVELVQSMRDLHNLQPLLSDIIVVLRPVPKAGRETQRLIEASPRMKWLWEQADIYPCVPPTYRSFIQTPNATWYNPSDSASFLPSAVSGIEGGSLQSYIDKFS